MPRFSYRQGQRNVGLIVKHPDDETEYQIDWADGILTGDSVSTVTSTSVNSSNTSADTVLLDSTTNSGTITRVRTLTGGTSGTAAATENARFKITTLATLTDGGELRFQVYLIIRGGGTYGPVA